MPSTASSQPTSGVSAMNDRLNTLGTSVGYGQPLPQAERQRVLRNTYWLLALRLLPTVLGAWLAVATGVTRPLTGGPGLIVHKGGAVGVMLATDKTMNRAA